MKKKLLAALLALALVLSGLFAVIGVADDFGGFAGEYDYNDDGGGWDDDDGGGYDNGGWFNNNDNDTPYYHSPNSPDDTSHATLGDLGEALGGLVVLIVLAAVFIGVGLLIRSLFGSSGSSSKSASPHHRTASAEAGLRPMDEYMKLDPAFTHAAFKEKLSNLYVRLQDAWHEKDLTPLRPYLSDALYAQSDRQLDEHRRKHQTSYIERIAVLKVSLLGWREEQKDDVIVARLKTRITTYILKDDTGELVRGSRTAEKFMEYEWTLTRSSDRRGKSAGGTVVRSCPNCGAPLNINRTAKCEYCDSIVTVDSYDWVLTSIRGISQRTEG